MDCRYCPGVQIRERKVLVGAPPGSPVQMFISKEPDPTGEVIERDDGKFRLLYPDQRTDPNKVLYRIHSRRACSPSGQRTSTREPRWSQPTSK